LKDGRPDVIEASEEYVNVYDVVRYTKYATQGNSYDPDIQFKHGSMENPNAPKLPYYRAAHGATVSEEEARVPFPKKIAMFMGLSGYGDVAFNEYDPDLHQHVDPYNDPQIIRKAQEKESQLTKDRLLQFYSQYLTPAQMKDLNNGTMPEKTKSKMELYKKRWLHITGEEEKNDKEEAESQTKKVPMDETEAKLFEIHQSLEEIIEERHTAYKSLFYDTFYAIEAVRWIIHSHELSPPFFESLDNHLRALHLPYIDFEAEREQKHAQQQEDDDDIFKDDGENADLQDVDGKKYAENKESTTTTVQKYFDNPQITSFLLNRTIEEHPVSVLAMPIISSHNPIEVEEESTKSWIKQTNRKKTLEGFYRHKITLSSTESTYQDIIQASKKKVEEEKLYDGMKCYYRVVFDEKIGTLRIFPEESVPDRPKTTLHDVQTFWKYYHMLVSNEEFRRMSSRTVSSAIELELIHASMEIRRIVYKEEREKLLVEAPLAE
jgi:hypothetical protein